MREGNPMKINVEVDCTPEEARRFMGLPDLTPVHDRYLQMMMETVENGPRPEVVEQMMRSWGPMGEAGMNFWRKMIEDAAKR
jgi:oligoendopeptidase F